MKNSYQVCDKCLNLLTAIHFTNSSTCDICERQEVTA